MYWTEDSTDDEAMNDSFHSSFFSTAVNGSASRDIGQDSAEGPEQASDVELKSDEQSVLNVYDTIGCEEFTCKRVECVSLWIIDKAVEEGIDKASKGAYIEVPGHDVSLEGNVVSSEVV